MDEFARLCKLWHERVFPHATEAHVSLKLASEAGEVCDAVLGTEDDLNGKGDVVGEVADLLLCAVTLIARYHPKVSMATVMDIAVSKMEVVEQRVDAARWNRD